MNKDSRAAGYAGSPLEAFVRNEIEAAGGAWDEIEPQVYDMILPAGSRAAAANDGRSPMLRAAFDPEALAEHPGAQLVSLGTPFVHALLADALDRGRFVELYLLGLNLRPQHLAEKVARSVSLPETLTMVVRDVRPRDYPQMVLWFEATFIADQREQAILPLAIDLHTGRQVRHLDLLLNDSRLSETPPAILPEAPCLGRSAAYKIARDQVLRSVASLANMRARELRERLTRQIARMTSYYDDLREELEAQAARGSGDAARYQSRRAALAQERDLRIAELQRKSALRAQLRLLHALVVHQPKLLVRAEVADRDRRSPVAPIGTALVWDPLCEALEAAACAKCDRPTLEFHRCNNAIVCAACRGPSPSSRHSFTR